MSRIALPILPMLVALTACSPAATSGTDAGAEAGAEAPEVVNTPESTDGGEASSPSDASAPDAPAPDSPADGSVDAGSAGGAPPPGSPPTPEVIAGPGLNGNCDASKVQDVVGKTPEQARVDDAVRRSGAKTVRVIPHDGMVTMDYRGDRLNLQLDEAGRIVAATCG